MTDSWLLVLVAPAVVAAGVIAFLRRSRWSSSLTDHPNERSLHSVPTPRLGGIGVLAGALPVAALVSGDSLGVVLACAAALGLVSLWDDFHGLPIQVRLPAHLAAAGVAVLSIASPAPAHFDPGVVEAVLAVVTLVWMTNLFNFMDGSDGLAGGMAAIGFGALAICAWQAGATPLALVAAALGSASVGFLAHNFPPARVFLGDAGSVPLGFLAGALGLYGALTNAWALWFPLLVFSPFIADATVTLVRRVVRGERFWQAHRDHYYQKLVVAGWTRRQLALRAYALMAAAAASALAAGAAGEAVRFGIILLWAVLYALLFIAIERRMRKA